MNGNSYAPDTPRCTRKKGISVIQMRIFLPG